MVTVTEPATGLLPEVKVIRGVVIASLDVAYRVMRLPALAKVVEELLEKMFAAVIVGGTISNIVVVDVTVLVAYPSLTQTLTVMGLAVMVEALSVVVEKVVARLKRASVEVAE